jgi:hypothetical protein
MYRVKLASLKQSLLLNGFFLCSSPVSKGILKNKKQKNEIAASPRISLPGREDKKENIFHVLLERSGF